jgi:hypothetical protein
MHSLILDRPVQATHRIAPRQPADSYLPDNRRDTPRNRSASPGRERRPYRARSATRRASRERGSVRHNETSRNHGRDYDERRNTRDLDYSRRGASTLTRGEAANRVRATPKPNGSKTDQEAHLKSLAQRGIAIRRTYEANQKDLNAFTLQGPNWTTDIRNARIGDVIQIPHHENCMDENMICDTISYWWPVLGGYLISKIRWALVVFKHRDYLTVRIFTTFGNTPRDKVREGKTDEENWNLSDYLQVVSLDNKEEFTVESRCSGQLNWRRVHGASPSTKKDSFMNIENGEYTHYDRLLFRIVGQLAVKKDIETLAVESRKASDRHSNNMDEVSKNWVPTPVLGDTPQRNGGSRKPHVDCPVASDGSANFLPAALRYDENDSVAEPDKDVTAGVQRDIEAQYSRVPGKSVETLVFNMKMRTTHGGRSKVSYADVWTCG